MPIQKISSETRDSKQLDFLIESARAVKGAHAYLFFGGTRQEKKDTAVAFALELTGCKGKWNADPDIFLIGIQEGEEKVLISQIREIKKFLSFEPYGGNNKVVIIEDFDKMRGEAANSILKILEEPPSKSVLILICENPRALLPTVLSRVQKISFSDLSEADIDKTTKALYSFRVIANADIAMRLQEAEKITKEEDGDLDILGYWTALLHDMIYLTSGCDELISNKANISEIRELAEKKQYSLEQLHSILSEIMRWDFVARTTNTNKRLILENIVLVF